LTLAKPGNPLRYNTPRSALPVSALAHPRGSSPNHQSHVLEHRDTYEKAQVCSNAHEGSSGDNACEASLCGQGGVLHLRVLHLPFPTLYRPVLYISPRVFSSGFPLRNPLPQSIRLRLSVLVRCWGPGRLGRVKEYPRRPQIQMEKDEGTYHLYTTTAR